MNANAVAILVLSLVALFEAIFFEEKILQIARKLFTDVQITPFDYLSASAFLVAPAMSYALILAVIGSVQAFRVFAIARCIGLDRVWLHSEPGGAFKSRDALYEAIRRSFEVSLTGLRFIGISGYEMLGAARREGPSGAGFLFDSISRAIGQGKKRGVELLLLDPRDEKAMSERVAEINAGTPTADKKFNVSALRRDIIDTLSVVDTLNATRSREDQINVFLYQGLPPVRSYIFYDVAYVGGYPNSGHIERNTHLKIRNPLAKHPSLTPHRLGDPFLFVSIERVYKRVRDEALRIDDLGAFLASLQAPSTSIVAAELPGPRRIESSQADNVKSESSLDLPAARGLESSRAENSQLDSSLDLLALRQTDAHENKNTGPESSLIVKVINLCGSPLRKVVRIAPRTERDVQDAFENLLIGAEISYSRESDRFEYSSKSYIPDFTLGQIDLAVDIKLCKGPGREKTIISEINDDILAYQTKYGNILFVVYDVGQIRDVERFTTSFERHQSVVVRVVKQ